MNYLVQGINQGAQNGAQAYLQMLRLADEEKARKLRQEETAAERRLRVQLAADSMANEGKLLQKRLQAEADGLTWRSGEADKDRTFTAGQELAKKFERDRRYATERFDKYDRNNPENQFRTAQINRLNAEADALARKQTEEPFAEVMQTSPDGLTKTRAKIPMGSLPSFGQAPSAPAVPNPYEAELQKSRDAIAANEIEMSNGDSRTGFLNLKSRRDVIDGEQRKMLRLQALAIQDRLERGEITQEQADQMSAKLMTR